MNPSIIVRTACVALVFLVAACASDPKDGPPKPGQQRTAAQERIEAEKLYRSAREVLDSGDMSTALTRYDKLSQQFPFSEFSTQGELERVYALYRNYQPDQALGAADKFIREHPRHSGAAYAQYLKGLINSTRDEGLSGFIGLDTTKEDVGFLRNAFDDFAVLVRKYPNSPYVGDARQRMIDLRNRVAQHEIHVVRFYVKRGAYIAAAKRAEQIVIQYPGAPASLEALKLLQDSYRSLNLIQQADDAGKLLAALSKSQAENDYPDYSPDALPKPFKDTTPVQVVPVDKAQVQDDSWLQSLLSVFGGSKESPQPATAQQATPAQAPVAATAPTAAEEDNSPDNPNLADVLKATFGQKASSTAKTNDNAPLTTEQAKARKAAANTPVQVVPVGKEDATQPAEPAAPPAPQDNSWFGKLTGLLGISHSNEDLAPGGRAKVSKTPLIKEIPPPPAAPAPVQPPLANDATPVVGIPEQTMPKSAPTTDVEVPAASEEDSWFGKLAHFFGASGSRGALATGGRTPASKEPLIKETPPQPVTAPTPPAAPTPVKPNTTVKKIPAQDAQKKEGNWFTRLFSIFDSSKSEPYTVVIPTSAAPTTKAPAPAKAVPAAESAEPTLDDVLADKPAAPAEPEKPKSKITIEMEPYDDAPAKPADSSAPKSQ